MLAITANWGIGDGSLADSRATAATRWLDAVRRAVVRAGWTREGRYRPIEEVTLLFAGDTFDWLLSERWSSRDRPWHGGARGEAARGHVAIESLRAARPVLRRLARWAGKGMPVPAATPRGRPSEWAEQVTRIRLVLLAGDRDAWLPDHAPFAARFGIATGEEWADGRRQVRHGHDLDPLSHREAAVIGPSGRQPTLAESLATDLVVPFALAARGDANRWPQVRPRLAAMSAARPAGWPALVSGMAGEGRDGDRFWWLWQRAVAAWHQAARRELPTCETEFDALGTLAAWLDRVPGDDAVPEAIWRLGAAADRRPGGGAVVAEPAGTDPPALCCRRGDGAEWVESLGERRPGPSIVAVGAGPGGSGFIDAA
jgi:hypothetical protein